MHGAAQPHQTSPHVLGLKPGAEKLVVHCRGTEIPEDGLSAARQKGPTRELVAFPFADLGRGDVANVIDVERDECAQFGVFERLAHATDAILV
jgi:hypothetical protein